MDNQIVQVEYTCHLCGKEFTGKVGIRRTQSVRGVAEDGSAHSWFLAEMSTSITNSHLCDKGTVNRNG